MPVHIAARRNRNIPRTESAGAAIISRMRQGARGKITDNVPTRVNGDISSRRGADAPQINRSIIIGCFYLIGKPLRV